VVFKEAAQSPRDRFFFTYTTSCTTCSPLFPTAGHSPFFFSFCDPEWFLSFAPEILFTGRSIFSSTRPLSKQTLPFSSRLVIPSEVYDMFSWARNGFRRHSL